jgi:hypothetical protein
MSKHNYKLINHMQNDGRVKTFTNSIIQFGK